MDSSTLVAQIQGCLKQVDDLRSERQAIGSHKVKAWKTEVEHLLKLGGKNRFYSGNLNTIRLIPFRRTGT